MPNTKTDGAFLWSRVDIEKLFPDSGNGPSKTAKNGEPLAKSPDTPRFARPNADVDTAVLRKASRNTRKRRLARERKKKAREEAEVKQKTRPEPPFPRPSQPQAIPMQRRPQPYCYSYPGMRTEQMQSQYCPLQRAKNAANLERAKQEHEAKKKLEHEEEVRKQAEEEQRKKKEAQARIRKEAETLVCLARRHLHSGSIDQALFALYAVLDLEPENRVAIQLRKKALELREHLIGFQGAKNRKKWETARIALDKCSEVIDNECGDVPIQWRLWGVALELAQGNWEAAGMDINYVLRLKPNCPNALTLRGLVCFLTANPAQALQHLQSALRLDPGHEPAQQLRKRVKDVQRLKEEGNIAFKLGEWGEATGKYEEALDHIGENEDEGNGGHIRAILLSNRAATLVQLRRYKDAQRDIEASLCLNPEFYKALRIRARIESYLTKYDAAVASFKSAIEKARKHGGEAALRSLQGELEKAEAAVLKRNKTKNYFKILGVSRDCTTTEIKKAYRRECLKHHPDKGGEEANFKLLAEAYNVLSDPQQREIYVPDPDPDEGEDEDDY